MISIVICSRTPTLPYRLSQNLERTIGCEFELVTIDNSSNAYTIFQAYNLGIDRSKGDIICFIHDDILFKTDGWGITIGNIFEEHSKAALIGVAGAKIKTKMPSAWWNCPENLKPIHILQHWNHGGIEMLNSGFHGKKRIEVAVIDGVFMAMRKSAGLKFNEKLQGFHNYDLNISIECKSKGFDILVTDEILIEHFSSGTINDSWYDSTLKLHEIYQNQLPVFASDFTDMKILSDTELANGRRIADRLWYKKIHQTEVKAIWRKLFAMKPLSTYNLRVVKRIAKAAIANAFGNGSK